MLKKNDREYIVAITPEETYSNPSFTFPEYFKNILDDSEYGFHELLCDDSIDVECFTTNVLVLIITNYFRFIYKFYLDSFFMFCMRISTNRNGRVRQ